MSQTLYRIAYSILHNNPDCEDAVQDAILKAFTSIRSLRDVSLFKPWFIRILKNECFSLLRKRKRLIPLDALQEATETLSDVDIDLYNALNALNPDMRLTVTLFYIERYTIDEITYILHVPAGTVKSRLARGRETLREILGKEGE